MFLCECVCVYAEGMLGKFLGMVVGMGLDGEIRSSNSGKAKSGCVETSCPLRRC
jgi:hypothetical protein